jgi:hypothetical protein
MLRRALLFEVPSREVQMVKILVLISILTTLTFAARAGRHLDAA